MILTSMVIADTPSPSQTPRCARPNQEAQIVNPMSPDLPDSVKTPVTVLVFVTVGWDGNLVEEHLQRSSGNVAADQAALRAARQSQYAPKLVNCEPITGAIIFHAVFYPPGPSPTSSPSP
jgi:TonB family protein